MAPSVCGPVARPVLEAVGALWETPSLGANSTYLALPFYCKAEVALKVL